MFFRIECIQCTLYNVLKCTAPYKLVYSRENSVHAGMYNIYSGGHGLYHDNYRVGQVKKSCKKDRNRTGTGQEQDRNRTGTRQEQDWNWTGTGQEDEE